MAGVSRLQYTTEIRLIRVMCSGRVDLEFILRSLWRGQDGVFIGGCRLGECNYVTHGNFDALANVHIARRILENIGLDPDRLSIEFMSGGDGHILAAVIDKFVARIKGLGPIGEAEGIAPDDLKLRLEAARRLVPYLKLVERERLRVPAKTEAAYAGFFGGAEMDRLFEELVAEKLAVSQILLLLKESPLSTGDIAARLGLSPSAVSKHMNSSSRQGLVRYDTTSNRYALA
jgi:coenzyme F420-reducing hydrogenase delta subunit